MKIRFQVTGMTCAACSARVEKVTRQTAGVDSAEVNLLANTMVVEAKDESVIPAIQKAVSDAGYGAIPETPGKKAAPQPVQTENPLKEMKTRLIASAVFLVVLMYFTMGHMIGLPVPMWYHHNPLMAALLQFFLTLPVVYLNRVYYTRGLKALWHRAPNMDSLIAVGSLAALIYGAAALFRMAAAMGNGDMETVHKYGENLYFESASMILTLITLGKFLETRAKGKTSDAIRALMDLSPKTATVRRDGVETEVAVDDVRLGDTVIVRSGGRIPADGTVLSGRASVDQSALTGESVPVEKAVGDPVAAFTIPLLFSMPSARPLIKSGIQLSKSVRGPSSGTEKCRWERIVFATSVTALATAPIQLRIPFTIPLMISAPQRHPADARPVM